MARFVDVVLSDTPAAPPVISQPVDAPPVVVEPEKAQPARRLRSVPVPARAAGIIAAVTLWSTGMAAAATGHLPDPVQRAVSNTAAHVGLSLPDPSDDVTVQADEQRRRRGRRHDDVELQLVFLVHHGIEHDQPADDDGDVDQGGRRRRSRADDLDGRR